MPKLLFVYGTLKRDGSRFNVGLRDQRYLGIARTKPGLVLLTPPGSGYPAMVIGDETSDPGVWGELFEVTEERMTAIDKIEGVPHLYDRARVDLAETHLVNMPETPEVVHELDCRVCTAYLYQRDRAHLKAMGTFWSNKRG